MKWVARERPRTDRIACPWLIRNLIDAEAEFLHIPASEVLEVAEREGARSDDAPGVRYTAIPESRGLFAIAEGFSLLDLDDHRQLELSLPVYDALYAWRKTEAAA